MYLYLGLSLATIMCMYGRCRETRERGERDVAKNHKKKDGWLWNGRDVTCELCDVTSDWTHDVHRGVCVMVQRGSEHLCVHQDMTKYSCDWCATFGQWSDLTNGESNADIHASIFGHHVAQVGVRFELDCSLCWSTTVELRPDCSIICAIKFNLQHINNQPSL